MVAPIGYPEQFGALVRRDPQDALTLGNALKQPEAGGGIPGETPNVPNVEGPTFVDHLKGFVAGIDQTQKTAQHTSEEFAVGHHNDIHGTMIAVEQAEISLHLLANVRNRVVDLYREVMRMGS